MSPTDVQRLIDFAELDQRLDRLIQEQTFLAEKGEALHQEIAFLKAETEQASQKVHQLRKQIDAIELEIKVLVEQKAEKTTKLNRASSPKEFFSLESEIQDLEKKQAPLDDEGLALLEELENAQKTYDLLKAQESEKLTALQRRHEEILRESASGQELIQAYTLQRVQDEKGVPADLLMRYNAMKEKVANPVVPIIKGSCSACFYAVNQPDIIETERGNLVTCRDCYRLLYTSKQPDKNDNKEDEHER